jgi:hypothetical protein
MISAMAIGTAVWSTRIMLPAGVIAASVSHSWRGVFSLSFMNALALRQLRAVLQAAPAVR